MPFRLPIFPLAVVLFPGNPLPLHVFEPKYRRLLSDVLVADRRFGITPLASSADEPAPGSVGSVAEVRLNQELPDGRSNIVVIGISRFTVARLLEEPAPYPVAWVEPFEDEPGSEPSAEDAEALRTLFGRYFAGFRELTDNPPEEPTLPEDSLTLSFHVAGNIECDLAVKQRLLAERSTARRVNDLRLLLPLLTSAVEQGLEVHRRSHSNGKGGNMPDILANQ
jgi:ATP-dependent Lon protease